MKTSLLLLFAALVTVSRSHPFNPEETFPRKWILELVDPSEELVPNLARLLQDMSDPHTWELRPYSNNSMNAWDFEFRVPTTWSIDPTKDVKFSEIDDGGTMDFFLEPTDGELGVMRTSHNVPHLPHKAPVVLELDRMDSVTLKQDHGKVSLVFSVEQVHH